MSKRWGDGDERARFIAELVEFLDWLNDSGSDIMAGLDYLPDYEKAATTFVEANEGR